MCDRVCFLLCILYFFVAFVWSQAAWVKGGCWRLIKSQTPFSVQRDALLTSNMAASAELPAFKGVDCLISRRVSARRWRIVKHKSEPRVPAWHPACYLKTPPSMPVFGRPANACLIREAEITVHQRGFLPARCHGSLFRRVRVNSKKGGWRRVWKLSTPWLVSGGGNFRKVPMTQVWNGIHDCCPQTWACHIFFFFSRRPRKIGPPVSEWLTARRDRLNSSGPCSSQSGPACSRGCAGWAPPSGSRSWSGRCCRSGGTAGRAEGRWGCSSCKERRPTGSGCPRCSGYDWKQEGRRPKQGKEEEAVGGDVINCFQSC